MTLVEPVAEKPKELNIMAKTTKDVGKFGLIPLSEVIANAKEELKQHQHDERVHPILKHNPLFERNDYYPSTKIGAH